MRRRVFIIAGTLMAIAVLTVGGMLYAIHRAENARLGPVHRFPVLAGESFLSDERAVEIAREVMKRDRLPESAWKLMEDDRTKAPDGRPDRYLSRNLDDPNIGMIAFYSDHSQTPTRYVNLEFRNGEITARGAFGK